MKRCGKKMIAGWLVCLLLCIDISVTAEEMAIQYADQLLPERTSESVEVSTSQQLISALKTAKEKEETLIIISGSITIGEEEESDGRMIPVEIPGGVTLQGADAEAELYCRCPLQIAGDNVTIQNLNLRFVSSNALESVPHREIFLGGHSLVLDNVDTYLEGNGGEFGNLGGTEEELLPTIYAGAYGGKTVSDNAVLTIKNANENTMFEAIYMGHAAGADSKEAYTGKATMYVGPNTVVRNGIYVNQNESAEIFVTGKQYSNLTLPAFYGNANTILQIEQVAVNNATVSGIGTILLVDGGYLQLTSGNLGNVTLQGGACLDLNQLCDVSMSGNLTGGIYDASSGTDTRGILVLNKAGSLAINGSVTGTTLLHTSNHNFPGEYEDEKTYITANGTGQISGFVIPDSKSEYYELDYESGAWTVFSTYSYEAPIVDSIEILSAPQNVDISKIVGSSFVPAEDAPYCSVVWKDENGNAYTTDEVIENQFYARDMIIAMRKDYWEGTDADEVTAWGVPVRFVRRNDVPGYYYFYMESGQTVEPGTYIYLFCSEYFDDLRDVADVKTQLAGKVKATLIVTFYDTTDTVHVHSRGEEQIIPAFPGKDGSKTTVCKICGEVLSSEIIYSPQTMTLSKSKYTYNGKLCKPNTTLKDRRGRVIDTAFYTVSYIKNKNVGKAMVTVTMKGKYGGTLQKSFTISPKKTAISKITSEKNKFTIKWKKISAQITGYQIQYSTGKKFTKKTTKTLLVKSKKTVRRTIKKPKAGRKYYVRIRTYKTVKVNGKTTKIYSAWSAVKTAK